MAKSAATTDCERAISILKFVSLVCVSIVFAMQMQRNVEKYVLRKPKSECWMLFVFVMMVVAALYFGAMCLYKSYTSPMFDRIYNL